MEYKKFCEKVGAIIKIYRIRKGYSLNDFANEMDVNYQHIQKLENGNNLPLFFNMLRIVELLDIPGNKIFGKDADNLDLQELSRRYYRYNDIIDELDSSKEFRDFARYYKKNREKLKSMNLVSAIETISKMQKNKK